MVGRSICVGICTGPGCYIQRLGSADAGSGLEVRAAAGLHAVRADLAAHCGIRVTGCGSRSISRYLAVLGPDCCGGVVAACRLRSHGTSTERTVPATSASQCRCAAGGCKVVVGRGAVGCPHHGFVAARTSGLKGVKTPDTKGGGPTVSLPPAAQIFAAECAHNGTYGALSTAHNAGYALPGLD